MTGTPSDNDPDTGMRREQPQLPPFLGKGDKFALYVFEKFVPQPRFHDLTYVPPDCWVAPHSLLHPDEWLEHELGAVFTDIFKYSIFSIMVRRRSQTAGALDQDLRNLHRRLDCVLKGLQILGGVGYYKGAALLGGITRQGELHFNSVGMVDTLTRLDDPVGSKKPRPRKRALGPKRMGLAVEIAGNLETLYAQDTASQFSRGLLAFFSALNESGLGERLHQIVRAIESLMALEKGSATKGFGKRGVIFAGNASGTRDQLLEMYEMRGKVEHLKDWRLAMTGYSNTDERDRTAERRLRQAEELACVVLSRILRSKTRLQYVADDVEMERFWKMPEADRRRVWGESFDISKVN